MSQQSALRPIVVVLAMHRSGSSVLTRGLQALNVDLGDNLMPPVPNNNETGFWEDLDLNSINERLFGLLGSSWDRLDLASDVDFESDEFFDLRMEARSVLASKTSCDDVFGFKDPRTAVLMPFWKAVFADAGLAPRYVISVRSPFEVALSLQKRDGFPLSKGFLLWAKHALGMLRHTKDCPNVFVSYQNLLDAPSSELCRIASILDLSVPEQDSLAEFEEHFLDQRLHHNRVSRNELTRSRLVPRIVKELDEVLLQMSFASTSDDIPIPMGRVNELLENFLSFEPFFAIADDLDVARKEDESRAKNAENSLKEIEKEVSALKLSAKEKADRLSLAEEEVHRSTSALSNKDQEIGDLKRNIDEYKVKVDDSEAKRRRIEHQLAEKGMSADAAIRELDQLKNSNTEEIGLLTDAKIKVQNELALALKSADDLGKSLDKSSQELADANQKYDNLFVENERLQAANSACNAELGALKTSLEQTRSSLSEHVGKFQNLSVRVERDSHERKALSAELRQRKVDLRLANAERFAIRRSLWWRLGAPLRLLGRVARKISVGRPSIMSGGSSGKDIQSVDSVKSKKKLDQVIS